MSSKRLQWVGRVYVTQVYSRILLTLVQLMSPSCKSSSDLAKGLAGEWGYAGCTVNHAGKVRMPSRIPAVLSSVWVPENF